MKIFEDDNLPASEEVARISRSQGKVSLFLTATMSPTFSRLLFTLSSLPFLK